MKDYSFALFNSAFALLSLIALLIMQGINSMTEPRIVLTAKKTVVAKNIAIAKIPKNSFIKIIKITDSGVSEKITPGNFNVKPPQVNISRTTPPHIY